MNAPIEEVEALEEAPECIEAGERCRGAVEYRMGLSATGRSFPRCEGHWSARLELEDRLRQRYPTHAPADFDPSYAGERWNEDY